MKHKEPISPEYNQEGKGLYIVATPIGNLEDMGFRALRILTKCDWVAAEDTRETRKLLEHYGISPRLHSLHEHSSKIKIQELVSSLSQGQCGAYVSDAGTPGLCDPGSDLVRACAEAGVKVFTVPGPSALLALLSVSGFKGPGFSFHGFFPRENKHREEWSKLVKTAGGLQLFFESPHRIISTLVFLEEKFPLASLVVGRELTKRFETVTRGTCQSIAEALKGEEPRGEYVLALELPIMESASIGLSPVELEKFVKDLAQLGATQKVLVRAGMSHGMSKNEAYKLALEVLEK